MKNVVKSLLTTGLLVLSAVTYGGETIDATSNIVDSNIDDTNRASVALAGKLADMQQVQAEFVQTITAGDGELIQQSVGKVHAMRPAKLRWRINQPDEQLIVIDGDKVWRFEADLEQVTVDAYQPDQSAPQLLLSGDVAAINKGYSINQTAESSFVLTPKDESSLFMQITVVFAAEVISQLTIVDGFDQTTHIQLSNVDITTPHISATYEFSIPEGVDVLVNE